MFMLDQRRARRGGGGRRRKVTEADWDENQSFDGTFKLRRDLVDDDRVQPPGGSLSSIRP
jgi:hypothetical protein